MAVDTKKAAGRRTVRYESYEDVLADIRRLAAGEHRTIGNWTLPQIVEHLARGFTTAIEGTNFRVPWLMKTVARIFMKRKFLTKAVPAGFKIPDTHKGQFKAPPNTLLEDAIAHLEHAIARCRQATQLQPHPVLGKLTSAEWEQFNLRHAELHLSFVSPDSP